MYRKLTITYRFENDKTDRTTEATLTNEDLYTCGDYRLAYYEPATGRCITTYYGADLPTPADMADDALYELSVRGRRCDYVEIDGAAAFGSLPKKTRSTSRRARETNGRERTMANYYVLTAWYDENDPYETAYYTVTRLGEDHPRFVNACYRTCFDWASDRARVVHYPGIRRRDDEDYILADLYNDTGHRDGMKYVVNAVFRLED